MNAELLPEPHDEQEFELPQRPRTRGECLGGERPCPWVSCRYHLYLEVLTHGNSRDEVPYVRINAPGEPWELTESCALDVADQGEQTLEFVGDRLHITRERIRQLEAKALRHAQARMRRMQVGAELREEFSGEKHRPDLNDPNQSTASLAGMSGGNFQGKVAAWQPENRKRLSPWTRRATTTTQTPTKPQENTMANPKPPKPPGIPRPDEAALARCMVHIKHLRSAGWTIKDLAHQLGVTPQHMGNIVNKKRGLSLALCEAVLALPQDPPADAATEPAPKKTTKAPAPKKPARKTETPTPAEQPVIGMYAPALARLDMEIAEATEAAAQVQIRLDLLRSLRAKWASS